MKIGSSLDDATRSRLARFVQRAGGGKRNLYAICDREQTICFVVVASCAEEGLKLCRANGMSDWTLGNTTTRSINRNVFEDDGVLTVVRLHRNRPKGESYFVVPPPEPSGPVSG